MLFSRITGHERIKESFFHVLKNSHLGNAYIFYGLDGTGKKIFAIELAKALNCLQLKSQLESNSNDITVPCNECTNCKRIENKNFPDLFLIEPENGQIKIEQIREAIKEIAYFPSESDKRFFLINDAHLMNTAAANTFLKTLEDSSAHTVFILIASNLYSLPSTIISRCQLIKFSPLKNEEICSILSRNEIPFKEDVINQFCSGSVSKAIAHTSKFDLSSTLELYDEFSSLKKEKLHDIFNYVEKLMSSFDELGDIIIIFKILYFDILKSYLKIKHSVDVTVNSTAELKQKYENIIRSLLEQNSISSLNEKIDILNKMEMEQVYNLNRRLGIERILFKLL
jgi:DNA polymerase III subunit delta'